MSINLMVHTTAAKTCVPYVQHPFMGIACHDQRPGIVRSSQPHASADVHADHGCRYSVPLTGDFPAKKMLDSVLVRTTNSFTRTIPRYFAGFCFLFALNPVAEATSSGWSLDSFHP
jgi:hypothetical protein